MIRLTKGPIPQVLEKNATEWTKTLLNHKAEGKEPTEGEKSRYRHKEIKVALIEETHGKCAYCESKIRHVAHGDVEHITPKSLELSKIFEWNNLTLACQICNQNKSDHFGDHENLVDPYEVEPTDHFFFSGPLIMPLPAHDPAILTESVLKLNRPELIERRVEKIRNLAALVDIYVRTKDPETQVVLKKNIEIQETEASREYAGLARHFINEVFPKICSAPAEASEGVMSTEV